MPADFPFSTREIILFFATFGIWGFVMLVQTLQGRR